MKIVKIERKNFEEMNLPETLYKYRDWEKVNNRTILTERQVYFAPPDSFDDKDDCKIPVRWDLLTDQEIFQIYYQDSRLTNQEFTRKQHRQFAREWTEISPMKDKEYLKEKMEQDFADFNRSFGILSLTSKSTNLDLWINYSNNHKGFAVGFDPLIVFKYFGGGGPVEYYSELPIINPHPFHSYEEQHFLKVFSKLEKCRFEDEYRIQKFKLSELTLNDRLVKLPAEGYKEIILGAFIDNEIKKDLLNSIPQELKEISVRQAKIVENKIEIE